MSIIKMDSEDIATIKNALCVIQLNADMGYNKEREIQKQVKRINGLLPKVKFEGKK